MKRSQRFRWVQVLGSAVLLIVLIQWGVAAQQENRPPVKAEPPEFHDSTPPMTVIEPRPSVLDASYLPPPQTEEHKSAWEAMRSDTVGVQKFYELGNVYYDEGQRDLARYAFEEAIRRDPDHLPSRVNLGVVLNETGKAEEAILHLEYAVAHAPDDVMALCNLGLAYYSLENFAKAVDLYTKALSIDPESQLAHYNLGVAFADAGIYEEAIREWRQVAQIDPKSDAARQAQDNIRVLRNVMKRGD
ncbi:MAG: tetratricopeptide repeat protein [Candidatus Eisenbacteria bacterium]|uniref:Tetratricopeptide repeat protein n=1 Tax=Eiseniibacteriota bacterium TaxID=2212470 RepID=A0A948W552_UNCEI|nr:tetratricopeptide repeat protein [Candidatus Eisenbacteria bacterium]MBU1948202.1 tetratricopeptide repeat protein [Candidatus Eisenbacteria bacterium]MBU2689665.1 tetratricopeptide repeat protein [Candidatus Eisenbacteria bacterium]